MYLILQKGTQKSVVMKCTKGENDIYESFSLPIIMSNEYLDLLSQKDMVLIA